jgi:perosamine synthetase
LIAPIAVNEPLLGERELEYVTECIRTGWVSSSGRFIAEFEEGWAEYCGRAHGVAMSNGTVALQAAVAALDLEPGDEVVMPTFTIISCASAVIASGGVPVLVDSDPETWCIDVTQLASKITPRTRAVMPVHIYGHPVDMDPLLEIARDHHLAVVEDAAEAHGAGYLANRDGDAATWKRCGSFGELSCFSFYANKLITTGEGGMVLTDDDGLAERLRGMRNLCFEPGQRFYHQELGFNFRLTNLQAALGAAQLERIDDIVERKRAIAASYTEGLQDIEGLQLPVERHWARSVYWMYGIVLDEATGLLATDLADVLQQDGIETRPFFLGMHEQPVLLRRGLFAGEHYPVAERLARQGLYLPSGLALTDSQIEVVVEAVHRALA